MLRTVPGSVHENVGMVYAGSCCQGMGAGRVCAWAGSLFPRLPEIQGHWGAAAKQRGAESRHIPLAFAEAQRTALCANKRETVDGDVTDALVGRPSRHKSHRVCNCRAAAGMGLNRVAAASGLGLAYWVVHAKAQSTRKGPEQKTLHQCGCRVTFLQTWEHTYSP